MVVYVVDVTHLTHRICEQSEVGQEGLIHQRLTHSRQQQHSISEPAAAIAWPLAGISGDA